jgi:hypothetical protein
MHVCAYIYAVTIFQTLHVLMKLELLLHVRKEYTYTLMQSSSSLKYNEQYFQLSIVLVSPKVLLCKYRDTF